jgi:dihydropteroate synthase
VTIVGVLNLTPDSFSDGGRFVESGGAVRLEAALAEARQLIESGAQVIDVGGESTRPGSQEVSVARELELTLPVVEGLARETPAAISIDTRKAPVARAAISAGASIVNDVSGLRFDPAMAETLAASNALLILGHTRGTPAEMQSRAEYDDVLVEVISELEESIARAEAAGIARSRLIADPGIGFAKRAPESLELLAHCGLLRDRLDLPLLVGPSRKSFLGEVTGDPVGEREAATLAACAVAAFAGADALRVHDASGARRAAQVGYALRTARRKELS